MGWIKHAQTWAWLLLAATRDWIKNVPAWVWLLLAAIQSVKCINLSLTNPVIVWDLAGFLFLLGLAVWRRLYWARSMADARREPSGPAKPEARKLIDAGSHGRAMRSPQAKTYGMLALWALAAFVAEFQVGFALGFAPGWANGLPGGVSIHRAWSGVMTGIVVATQMTLEFGLGALTSLLLCQFPAGRRYAGFVLGAWLVICIALTMLTCPWVYREIYASTLAMWPNGYPAGRP